MKKSILFFLLSMLFLTGCTSTFMGGVFILSFGDVILYVFLAFILGLLIAFKSSSEKRKTAFWLGFILSLILTPLAGFIYFLILLSRKGN
jgi:hypothetical protein